MSYIEPHMVESLKDHILEEIVEPIDLKHPRFKPGQQIRIFRCGRADSGVYSTVLFFTPYGISIRGDLMLGGQSSPMGIWSSPGYDLDWFVSRQEGDYLCSKFYRECWQREAATEWCRQHAKYIREGEYDDYQKALKSVRERLDEIVESLQDLDGNLKEWTDSTDPEKNDEIRAIEAERKELFVERQQIEKDIQGIRQEYANSFEMLADDLDLQDVGDVRGFVEELDRLGYPRDGDCPGYDYPLAEAGWLCALQQKFAELYKAKFAAPATPAIA